MFSRTLVQKGAINVVQLELSYTTKISHFAKGKLSCSSTEIPEYGLSRMNKRSAADFGVERVHREYMTM